MLRLGPRGEKGAHGTSAGRESERLNWYPPYRNLYQGELRGFRRRNDTKPAHLLRLTPTSRPYPGFCKNRRPSTCGFIITENGMVGGCRPNVVDERLSWRAFRRAVGMAPERRAVAARHARLALDKFMSFSIQSRGDMLNAVSKPARPLDVSALAVSENAQRFL